MKGYVSREAPRAEPEQRVMDYDFTSKPGNALFWDTKEEAEVVCKIFNDRAILIPSSGGGKHRCAGFQVEESEPGKFVVFCDAPFIPQQSVGVELQQPAVRT
jgi:hypothetical protein